jgi:phosphatidate cytidylyltransferase
MLSSWKEILMGAANVNLIWMIFGSFAALSIGTAIRLVALRNSSADVARKRIGSLKVWWMLALLWSAAALIGQAGAAVLLATASFLGMREYLRLLGTTNELGRGAMVCLIVWGAMHYCLIVGGASEVAKWFMPVGLLLVIGAVRASTCGTSGYIRATAGMVWGAMLMIYALSHALYLFEIESSVEPLVGNSGWFLFLVLLTEMNDIMQAIVGRKFGRHKITPLVSPNKSLEGLLGGIVTSVALSVLLAPIMTTLTLDRSLWQGILLSIVAGLLISLTGFFGDINISAIKRDAGVKDGSSLLPGMGGVIDRIDSLIFTAPAFYYFVMLLQATTDR